MLDLNHELSRSRRDNEQSQLRIPLWLTRDLVLIFLGRGLRSLSQGYLSIAVPIYVVMLGYGAVDLGILYTAGTLASALLTLLVGALADRLGRKALLIAVSIMATVGALGFAYGTSLSVLVVAAATGTIGQGGVAGHGGAWGPYYPAEQALVTEIVADRWRTSAFGALSFFGVCAGALGSLMAELPDQLHAHFQVAPISAYRILFLATAVLSLAMGLIVIPVRERPSRLSRGETARSGELAARILGLSLSSWKLVGRFMLTNATNGLSIGIFSPFIVYWFHQRYGATATELGTLFFATNLVAAVPYLAAGTFAARLGSVNTVVLTRILAAVLIGVMALMPSFWLAGTVFLVRMAANTLSIPVRQSYLMGVVPASERASAAGLSNFPLQVTRSLGTYLGGLLMQSFSLSSPFEVAAVIQLLNAALYYKFFRDVLPPEEREARETDSFESYAATGSERCADR